MVKLSPAMRLRLRRCFFDFSFTNGGLKAFFAGVSLSVPFYAEFFSWYFACFLVIPLFFYVAFFDRRLKWPHSAILPMIALLMLHWVALIYTDTRFEAQVVKDMIVALFLFSIYFFIDEDVLSGFFVSLIPLGVISALAGLAKAALLDRGYLVGFILDSCYYYPAGSALCINYNNLGLLWLLSALACIRNRFWLFVPILIAAGALSSSRRFLVLMIFLPVIMVIVEGRMGLIRSLVLIIFSAAIVFLVTDSESFERFRFGSEPYTVIGVSKETQETGGGEVFTNINRSEPSVMLGTMADGTLGTASRLDFWQLAFSSAGLSPQGWSYHEFFSCEFSSCAGFSYPHMPVLSAWIIGGALFGVVAVFFYAWPLWVVWRRNSVFHISLLMISLPYSLISGDTVFSLPIFVSCMLVALSSVPKKNLAI